jgi:hypothetical protein
MNGNDSNSSDRTERWQFTERSDDDEDEKATQKRSTVSLVTVKEDKRMENSEEGLAKDESRRVSYSKLLVILVLSFATGVVAYATYDITQKEAEHDWIASVSPPPVLPDWSYRVVHSSSQSSLFSELHVV